MTKDTLLALAERVEAYDPRQSLDNRADEMPLDLAVAKAIGLASDDWQVARGSVTGYFSGDGVGGFGNPTVPRYTRSLDDAMTAVPENCLATVRQLWDGPLIAGYAMVAMYVDYSPDCDGKLRRDVREGIAATPALALTAAALRARAATPIKDHL